MKKLKLILMVLAVSLGIGGALATKAANHKSLIGDPTYYWFDGSGYTDNNTVANEKSATQCTGIKTHCEYGYTSDELINPSDPSEGVKTGSMAAQELKHVN